MSMVQGHMGCPECGCPKFSAVQDRTAFETEEVHARFIEGSDDPGDFEITDYGDIETHDADVGDMHEQKQCRGCKHVYTEPVFVPCRLDVELVADENDLAYEDVEPFADIIESLQHVSSLSISQERHATVIEAHPSAEARGQGKDQWRIEKCTKCQGDMSESFAKTEQVYEPAPTRSGNQKVFDKRGLPVLVHLHVCRSCR